MVLVIVLRLLKENGWWDIASEKQLGEREPSECKKHIRAERSEKLKEYSSSIFDICNLKVPDHLDPEILPFHHPGYDPLKGCVAEKSPTILNHGRIYMIDSSRNYTCKARCVFHINDREYSTGKWFSLPTPSAFPCDVVETFCLSGTERTGVMHSQIFESKDHQTTSNSIHRPDVYIIVIDSMSSSMGKRSLPKTVKLLKEEMGGILMEFFNKIGQNSKPNGFAFIFGKSIIGGNRHLYGLPYEPDWEERTICSQYLDNYKNHLRHFSDSGYKTMSAQDEGAGVAYHPNCKGYKYPEADHMWRFRPFPLRINDSSIIDKSHKRLCSERHTEMLKYMEMFINSYTGTPKIGQLWVTKLAHNTVKKIYHADDHFHSFLLRNGAKLNNSFLIMIGDHGPRFDGILRASAGYYESKNPFLLITVPKQYRKNTIYKELIKKAHQLVTPFDLHATLMDIAKIRCFLAVQPLSQFNDSSSRNMEPLSKGSSLFRPFRGERNCRTLSIPPNYCLCRYDFMEVSNVTIVDALGEFIAKEVNEFVRKRNYLHKCSPQFYKESLGVKMIKDHLDVIYEVSIVLWPTNGLYSAFVRETERGFVLNSDIERRDVYGNTTLCIRNAEIQPYCNCRKDITWMMAALRQILLGF
ncbi:hypothetical protein Q1695_003037 [Nippostrongylus brasiliensis]|nr:hypothetical protein Q1695_003037 [Nippostrongylus brasiliensis]